jgi:hypothetical protein
MEDFLLVVFWIIVAFYLLRLGLRFFLPRLINRFVRKMSERMSGTQQTKSKKEGEISVKYNPVETPRIDPDAGEYVDFEEIKDNNKKK